MPLRPYDQCLTARPRRLDASRSTPLRGGAPGDRASWWSARDLYGLVKVPAPLTCPVGGPVCCALPRLTADDRTLFHRGECDLRHVHRDSTWPRRGQATGPWLPGLATQLGVGGLALGGPAGDSESGAPRVTVGPGRGLVLRGPGVGGDNRTSPPNTHATERNGLCKPACGCTVMEGVT